MRQNCKKEGPQNEGLFSCLKTECPGAAPTALDVTDFEGVDVSKHIYSPDVARYELAAASKVIRKLFVDQVKCDGPDGCWEWLGKKGHAGYGRMNTGYRGGEVAAHRLALFLSGRPVPPDRVVDHLCRNPGCVNPKHLDIVTQEVNMARGRHALKTHCTHGHEFTEENTGWQKVRGVVRGRYCRTCARSRNNLLYRAAASKT